MTSLFQTLIDFLEWFFNPLMNAITTIVMCIGGFLSDLLFGFLRLILFILNSIIYGFSWIIDKGLVLFTSLFSSLFGTTGLLGNLPGYTTITGFVGSCVNAGAKGLTWIGNFCDLNVLFMPFVTYLSFLIVWTAYKFIKSWIPGIGR